MVPRTHEKVCSKRVKQPLHSLALKKEKGAGHTRNIDTLTATSHRVQCNKHVQTRTCTIYRSTATRAYTSCLAIERFVLPSINSDKKVQSAPHVHLESPNLFNVCVQQLSTVNLSSIYDTAPYFVMYLVCVLQHVVVL